MHGIPPPASARGLLPVDVEYIQAALEKARYEIIEDDDPYYGEISRDEWFGE